ncbi:acetylglutamate kinase [Larkinella knui]|uniref:Acetylglutamate kinase n=1 Tax=Larkinella knui TaxID=2025310 RepID=A0A3P1CEJ1_9BACT|nr:acetylglutamate kinase [Larkinella knui]RRB11732.1 acetylglutamate kinase [Larkinella knui]
MKSLIIIKIGGNVIDNPDALKQFLTSFRGIYGHKILIHGGGKIATQVAEKLGIQTTMVDGRRITDQPMLDVVTMVYGGLVNKQIVAQLQAIGVDAIGLTGADGNTVLSKKRAVGNIDYGFVGDIEEVNSGQIQYFIRQNLVPVFAPLTYDRSGSLLNTNADTMASAIAVDMAIRNETTLVYCFEKKGVLADPNNEDSVLAELTPESYANYKSQGVISKGMIPKLDNAFSALEKGVRKVIICHANQVAEAVSGSGVGTVLSLGTQE